MKIFFLVFFIVIVCPCALFGQQEDFALLTYFPAPYGCYDQMQAITYTDRNDPDYFLDLDGRSKIVSLNVSVPSSNTVQKALLQVGGTLDSTSNDMAAIYAKTVDAGVASARITVDNYAAIYGETNRGSGSGDGFGVYGFSNSNNAVNVGVYGVATGAPDAAKFDYGVFGVGDDCGVVGGVAKVGIAGIFGKNTAYTPPSFNCALYGVGQDVTVDGTTRRAHGIYSRCDASGLYAGYFESGNNSGNGVRAYSTAHDGIIASAGNAGYGGYFWSDWKGVYLNSESTSSIYAEITSGDDDLSILVGESGGGSSADFTFMAPYGYNSGLRVIYRDNSGNEQYTELFCNDDDDIAYIRSSRELNIEPSTMPTWADQRTLTIMGNVRWKSAGGWTTVHTYSDLAESFELTDKEILSTGDLVEVDSENKGYLKKTANKNNKAVGIISSDKTAAVVIGYREDGTNDKPLALAGRVLCNVDAGYGEIMPGDLLVKSPVPGYAMKARPVKEIKGQKLYCNGVIVGKALQSLKKGKGKILVLVM